MPQTSCGRQADPNENDCANLVHKRGENTRREIQSFVIQIVCYLNQRK
jgi:hypothetical protein